MPSTARGEFFEGTVPFSGSGPFASLARHRSARARRWKLAVARAALKQSWRAQLHGLPPQGASRSDSSPCCPHEKPEQAGPRNRTDRSSDRNARRKVFENVKPTRFSPRRYNPNVVPTGIRLRALCRDHEAGTVPTNVLRQDDRHNSMKHQNNPQDLPKPRQSILDTETPKTY